MLGTHELVLPYLTSAYGNPRAQINFTAALDSTEAKHTLQVVDIYKLFDKQFDCDRYSGTKKLKISNNNATAFFSKSIIERHIDKLFKSIVANDSVKHRTLSMPTAFFVSLNLTAALINHLDGWLTFKPKKNGFYYFAMPVKYREENLEEAEVYTGEYLLSVENDFELEYAKRIVKVFRSAMTFAVERGLVSKSELGFSRFASINVPASPRRLIHNTYVTFEASPVAVHAYLNHVHKSVVYNRDSPPELYLMDYKDGYVSSFAPRWWGSKRATLPVSCINVDLNYLNCYLTEMLNKKI
jgi:hypothetical protein